MSNNTSDAATVGIDLLAEFNNIKVNNFEKISEYDREICDQHQKAFDKTFANLQYWYNIYHAEALKYKDTHKVTYKPNGEAKYNAPYRNYEDINYCEYSFYPFDSLEKIVDKRDKLISRFANRIIQHFNKEYSIEVPELIFEFDKMPIDTHPNYMAYVDHVFAHLGGKGFREVAEDELIENFHNTVHRWGKHDLPDIKGKTITFYNLFTLEENYNNGLRLSYESRNRYIDAFCKGLAFFGQDRLNGDYGIIWGINEQKIDIKDWYPLAIEADMKFFKNGRVDIRFKDTAAAEQFYKKLRLDELERKAL